MTLFKSAFTNTSLKGVADFPQTKISASSMPLFSYGTVFKIGLTMGTEKLQFTKAHIMPFSLNLATNMRILRNF
jgi:hypothetical protein